MYSDDANLLAAFTASFDHGLLVVEDADSTAVHDGWDAASEQTHLDADSLYIGVRSQVDGLVTVSVFRGDAPPDAIDGMALTFVGDLQSNSGITRIRDSDEKMVYTARGKKGLRQIRAFMDHPEWPGRVVLILG